MGGRGSWAAPGGIPGAGDLVTHEFCHWWLRDLAAPADHVGPVFDVLVQGDVLSISHGNCHSLSYIP